MEEGRQAKKKGRAKKKEDSQGMVAEQVGPALGSTSAGRGRGGGADGATSHSLPPHLQKQRDRVQCDIEAPKHTDSIYYAGAYSSLGVDCRWTLQRFKEAFRVEVSSLNDNDLLFALVGLDPAIANAFRRVLLAEVPTMAIEKVFIADNTSLVQDEVLSHRLGLVPLKVDPRNFEFLTADGLANETNTIVYKLEHKCKRESGSGKVQGAQVLSGELTWLPGGSQYPPDQPQKKFTTFTNSQDSLPHFATCPPKPTYPDVVLAKLRPGQAMELEAHAVKGIGKTHAKWSPVATAFYKMLPEVTLKQPVEGKEAVELKELCPSNVFDIEEVHGVSKATAARPRQCTLCRECVRGEWAEKVQLTRVKTHFLFSIEGTGSLPPDVLFTEAVKVLRSKAERLISELL